MFCLSGKKRGMPQSDFGNWNEKSWNIFEMYFSVIWVREVAHTTYLVTPLWNMFFSFWPRWWIYGSYRMFFGVQHCRWFCLSLWRSVGRGTKKTLNCKIKNEGVMPAGCSTFYHIWYDSLRPNRKLPKSRALSHSREAKLSISDPAPKTCLIFRPAENLKIHIQEFIGRSVSVCGGRFS